MHQRSIQLAISVLLLILCAASSGATDWPQFLGPTRNGIYPGTDLAAAWPGDGPKTLWQAKVGQGFSGPVVAAGKCILFHRLEDKETIQAFDALTGKSVWEFAYPTTYRDDFGFDEGPRATPVVSDGKIFTYGAQGVLTCLELSTGKKTWQADLAKNFSAAKGFFGIACSPLADGPAVFIIAGGKPGAGVVAFDKTTGKLLWKATDDEASYSSPISADFGEGHCILGLTRSELVALEPTDGKLIFNFPFRPPIRSSVSAAMPLVIGNLIFISASYDTGATLLKVENRSVKKVWSGQDILSDHYATSVHHHGFLYGVHGRTDPGFEPGPTLRCVELATGKVRWEDASCGAATITLAGDDMLILTERGELIRAPTSPQAFKSVARFQALPSGVRAYPAIADGLFYARSKDKLVCLDLQRKQ
jgi:outer membrane protein assembly factor BamB